MKKIFILPILAAFMMVLFPLGVMADTTVDLIADGGDPSTAITVGYVEVTDDGTDLTVKYVIDEPNWCLVATHLDVQADPVNFPQTKNGNPKVGKFAYGEVDLGCVSEWESDPISIPGDPAYIAAHAVVLDKNSNVI